MVTRAHGAAWLLAAVAGASACDWRLRYYDADVGPSEANVVTDATVRDASLVCEPLVLATGAGIPRPIAPRSTATVASPHPTFVWRAPEDGTTTVDRVRLCTDRAMCTACQELAPDTTGLVAHAPVLAGGVWFWALHARSRAGADAGWSPTHEFVVPARTASVASSSSTSYGAMLDLDGDGQPELATATTDGHVLVWHWSDDGFELLTTLATSAMGFGGRVEAAGDVDGDGYGDVIVGACSRPTMTGGAPCAREAFVFYGDPTLVVRAAYSTLVAPAADAMDDAFGATVAAAGDVDGDGYGDVIVGAPGDNAAVFDTLRVAYVYYGGPGGLGTAPMPATLTSAQPGTFGWTLAGPGDLDGDGGDDVAVGLSGSALMTGTVQQFTNVYLYSGRALTRHAASAPTHVLMGDSNRFGISVGTAGDVNGDGHPDVAIGVGSAASVLPRVAVYAGTADPAMLATTPLAVESGVAGSGFGLLVVGGGDLTGDGYDDVAYSAPFTVPGVVYVLSAPPGSPPHVTTLAPSAAFTVHAFGTSLAIVGPVATATGRAHGLLVAGAPSGTAGQVEVVDLLADADAGATLLPPTANAGFGAWLAYAP